MPKVGSAAKSSISAVGSLGSKLISRAQKTARAETIASLLSEADIKYGDETLLKDDEMLEQCLSSNKPKDVIRALNTILSILVYCANTNHTEPIAPGLDSALTEEDDFRTRIMKRFYPSVVK